MTTTRVPLDRVTKDDVILLRWENDEDCLVWNNWDDDYIIYWDPTNRIPRVGV